MYECSDGWGCKFEASPEPEQTGINSDTKEHISDVTGCSGVFGEGDKDFSFPCGPSLSENDDELTESKIRSLLYQSEFLCLLLTVWAFPRDRGSGKKSLNNTEVNISILASYIVISQNSDPVAPDV